MGYCLLVKNLFIKGIALGVIVLFSLSACATDSRYITNPSPLPQDLEIFSKDRNL